MITKEDIDRIALRIDRMEDMQRIGSERTSALVNEMGITKVYVTRILKAVDGNGKPSMADQFNDQTSRLKILESVHETAAKTRLHVRLCIIGTAIALLGTIITTVGGRVFAPVNQAAAVKSADDRIDLLEKETDKAAAERKQILETLKVLRDRAETEPPPRQLAKPRRRAAADNIIITDGPLQTYSSASVVSRFKEREP